MKQGIHPEYYQAKVVCNCGNEFVTGSTNSIQDNKKLPRHVVVLINSTVNMELAKQTNQNDRLRFLKSQPIFSLC